MMDAERTVAETRKRFSSLYSMTSLVHYEAFVDRCADLFCMRLREFAARGEEFNLGHWFQCYAFDVIGDITYGKRFGEWHTRVQWHGRVRATD